MDHSRRNDIILIDIMCNYIRKNHKGLLQKHSPGRHPKKMLLKMYQQLMLPVVELNKLELDVKDNRAKSTEKPEVGTDELNDKLGEERDKSRIRNGRIFAKWSSGQYRKDSSQPPAKKHQLGRSSRKVIKAQQNRARVKKQKKLNGLRACTTIYKFLKHHKYLQSKLMSTYKMLKPKQVSRSMKSNGDRVRDNTVPADDNLACPVGYHRGTKQKVNGTSVLPTSEELVSSESEKILEHADARSAVVDPHNTECTGAGDTNILSETDISNMRKINAAFETKPTSNDEVAALKINNECFSEKDRNHFTSTVTNLLVPSKSSNISEISEQNAESPLLHNETRQRATNNKILPECTRKPAFEIATNLISSIATSSSGSNVTTGISYDVQVSRTKHEVQPKRESDKLVSDGSAEDGDVVLDVIGGLVDRVVDEERLLRNGCSSCKYSRFISADRVKETDKASLEHRLAELSITSTTGTGTGFPTSAAVNGESNDDIVQQSANNKSTYCCNVADQVRELMNDILMAICAQGSRPGLMNGKLLAASKGDWLCMTPDKQIIQYKGNNGLDTINGHNSDGAGHVHGTQNTSNKHDDYRFVTETRSDGSFETEPNNSLDMSEKRCFSTVSKTSFEEERQKHFLDDQHNGRLNHQLNTVADSVPSSECEAKSSAEQHYDVRAECKHVLPARALTNKEKSSRENGNIAEETSFEEDSVAREKEASSERWESSSNDNFKINLSHEAETEREDTLPDIPPVTDDMLQECVWKEKPKVRRRRKKLKFSRKKIRTQTSTESNGHMKQKKADKSGINRASSANQTKQQARKRKLVQERRKLYPRRASIFYASDFLFKSETEDLLPKRLRNKSPDEDTKSQSEAEKKTSKKKCNSKKSEKQEKRDTEKPCGSVPNTELTDSDGRLSVEFSKYNWFLEKYKVALKDENNDAGSVEAVRKPVKTKGRKRRMRKQIKLRIERSDTPDNEDCENDHEISNESENKPTGLQILKVTSLSSCEADKLPSADGGDMKEVKNLTSHNNGRDGELGAESEEDDRNPEPLMLTIVGDNDTPLDLSMKSIGALPLDLSLHTKKTASGTDGQRNDPALSGSGVPTSSYACFNLPIPKSTENTTIEPVSQIPNAHDHTNPPVKTATNMHHSTLPGDVVNNRYQSTLPVNSIAHIHPSSLSIYTTHVRPSTFPSNVTAHIPAASLSVNPSKHINTSTLPSHQATHMRLSSAAVNPTALPPPPILRSSPSLGSNAFRNGSSQSDLVIRSQSAVTHSVRQLTIREQRCSPSLQAPVACLNGTGQRRQMPHLVHSKTTNYHLFDNKKLPMESVDRLSSVCTRHSDTERIINVLSKASSGAVTAMGRFTQGTMYAQNPSGTPPYHYTPTSQFQECHGQPGFIQVPMVPDGISAVPSSGSDDWSSTRPLNRHGDNHLHRDQRSSQVRACTTPYRSQSISAAGQREEARYAHQMAIKRSCPAASTIKCQVCYNKATFLCSGCRKVAYCSRRCQCEAWKHHRRSCAV